MDMLPPYLFKCLKQMSPVNSSIHVIVG